MAKTRSMSRKLASEEPAESPPPLPAPARRTRGRPRRAPEQNAPATQQQQAAAATEQILPTTEQTALAIEQAVPTTKTEQTALATEQAAPEHETNEAVTVTRGTRASRAATARAARIAQTTQATRPTRLATTNKVTKRSTTSKASSGVRTRQDKGPYAWMMKKHYKSTADRVHDKLEIARWELYDEVNIRPHIANGGINSTEPWLGPRPPPSPPKPAPKSPSGRPLSMSTATWRRWKATKKQEDELERIRQEVAREQKEAAEAAARKQKEADEAAAAKEKMRKKREALVDEVMTADPSVRDRRIEARRQHYQQQGLPTPNSAKKRTASEMEETDETQETQEVQKAPIIATAREQVKRGFWDYVTSWVPRPWKRQRVEQTTDNTTNEIGDHPPVSTPSIDDIQTVVDEETAPPKIPRSPGRTYKCPSPTPSEIAEDDAEQAAWEKANGITYPDDDDEMKEASPVICRRSPGRTFTMPLPTAEEEAEEAAEYEAWVAAGGDEDEDVTMADASLLSAKPPSPAAATVADDDDFGELVASLAAAQAAEPSGPLAFLEQNLERLIGASGTGVLEASYAF